MSTGCGRSEVRKALAEELRRLEAAERHRLDAERRAAVIARYLPLMMKAAEDLTAAQAYARMAALLDMLATAAVVTLVVFVDGFGALAPLYIVFVSWRCRDLLPRPQRQWRGVMAAAATVACAACVSKVVASAGFVSKAAACAAFVSQAVAHAAFYPCVALLVARAALVTLTRVGLPLGSGMGGAAAAAAWAVNGLFGAPVPKDKLILAVLASEAAVSGYHADNVGPSLLGGFVLSRSCNGAGPTAVSIVDDPAVGARVAEAMSAAFRNAGKLDVNTAQCSACAMSAVLTAYTPPSR
ncbi:hypothetical protein CHLRE_02g082150v5 [Chlamydomonas reinhardtii]|uniref:GHMP kinase N-terminal domain-containing protein n=1 Tax=Chlamydomonas reinhardtii TaxID=3055 RepID=A0A2K3E0P4_CHLRE|nr:uncharacterized protein CHLRE_02g082150v5 [Chlamydomonas reinhardtii]PNW86327.1 hypothetical protein CHLRE_02g082150v5 [Chlamydomonas reinhardtii]